jgi:hypothetical protein
MSCVSPLFKQIPECGQRRNADDPGWNWADAGAVKQARQPGGKLHF